MNLIRKLLFIILSIVSFDTYAQRSYSNEYSQLLETYRTDSLNVATLSNESLNLLDPELNTLNDTSILKIDSQNAVRLLENYFSQQQEFYTNFPADKLEDTNNYLYYAEKYASGDPRYVLEVDSIVESGNKEAIKELLSKFGEFSSFYEPNPVTNTEFTEFIINALEEPFYESVAIPLIASLERPEGLRSLEKHLSKVQPENRSKLLYNLVRYNSKIGIEFFKDIIIEEKDSVLFKSDLNRILGIVVSTSYGKKIDDNYKAEIASLALTHVYSPIVSKMEKMYDQYSNRINIYDFNSYGRIISPNTLTSFIERTDDTSIPLLLSLIEKRDMISPFNTNFINLHLLRLGHELDKKALEELQNDEKIYRYICRNRIEIDKLTNSEQFYEKVFKSYISSKDINDIRFGKAVVYNALPYFKSVDPLDFKEQILRLVDTEVDDRSWPTDIQEEKANKLVKLHENMQEQDKDVIDYLLDIDFLSKSESKLVKKHIDTIPVIEKEFVSNLFRIIRNSDRTIRFSSNYKSAYLSLESTPNQYLKDFKTLIWQDANDKVEKLCIIYNNKAYAVNLNMYYPYDCKFDKLIEIINFILEDNGIEDKVIAHNKISCDIYFAIIGKESAIKRIEEKYLEY